MHNQIYFTKEKERSTGDFTHDISFLQISTTRKYLSILYRFTHRIDLTHITTQKKTNNGEKNF